MTGPAPTIRRMKIEDYPLVYGLWTRCTGFTMRDIDDSEDAIKTFLKRNPDTCFVAEDDGGRIIGAILAGHDSRRSRIYHTAVDPDARGMGIGSLLVGRVVEALRAIGLPKVAVGVPADNDAGNDFWEHQGFAVRDDLVYRELPLQYKPSDNEPSNTLALCLYKPGSALAARNKYVLYIKRIQRPCNGISDGGRPVRSA